MKEQPKRSEAFETFDQTDEEGKPQQPKAKDNDNN